MICVYEIFFLDTDWFYIGSSKHFSKRKSEHLNLLKKGMHVNPIIQNVYNKYPDKIQIRIIQETNLKDLRDLEQSYLDTFKPNLNISSNVYSCNPVKDQGNCYELLSPDGIIWATKNLISFAEEHNLKSAGLYAIIFGTQGQHRGWKILSKNGISLKPFLNKKLTENFKKNRLVSLLKGSKLRTKQTFERGALKQSKKYLITNPKGIQFCVKGMNQFCRDSELGLSACKMGQVALGRRKHHKNYKVESIS